MVSRSLAEREQRQREDLGRPRLARLAAVGLTADRDRGLSHERATLVDAALAHEQQRHHAEHDDRALQEQGRAVDRDRGVGGEPARAVVGGPHHGHERGDQRDEREPELQERTAAARRERLDQDPEARPAEQDEHRAHGQVVQRREPDLLRQRLLRQHLDGGAHGCASWASGAGSDRPTSCRVAATAGLITSSSGFG
jgi:hypothetical protein